MRMFLAVMWLKLIWMLLQIPMMSFADFTSPSDLLNTSSMDDSATLLNDVLQVYAMDFCIEDPSSGFSEAHNQFVNCLLNESFSDLVGLERCSIIHENHFVTSYSAFYTDIHDVK